MAYPPGGLVDKIGNYYEGTFVESGFVKSSIEEKASKLSVDSWFKIINSKEKNRKNKGFLVEYSHEMFARDFEAVCKKDRRKLIEVAEKVESKINNRYKRAIYIAQ